MVNRLVFILILVFGCHLYAQTTGCKVTKASISDSYTGGCKKGLAHGKGVAIGIDYYEGQFSKGLPDGNGTYRWSNGDYYEGQWQDGMREGEGKMVFRDSVVTGFWKNDRYIGEELIPEYEIIRSISVARYTITKSVSSVYGVRIRLMQGGSDNTGVEDFSLAYDSGDEYRSGYIYGIQNVMFPVTLKIMYKSWNQFRSARFNVTFEFRINDPGMWDVMISS